MSFSNFIASSGNGINETTPLSISLHADKFTSPSPMTEFTRYIWVIPISVGAGILLICLMIILVMKKKKSKKVSSLPKPTVYTVNVFDNYEHTNYNFEKPIVLPLTLIQDDNLTAETMRDKRRKPPRVFYRRGTYGRKSHVYQCACFEK